VGEPGAEGKHPENLRVRIPGKEPGNRTGCIVSEKGLFGEGNLY
jgi:hypothetical protein